MAVLKSIGDLYPSVPLLGDTITIGRGGTNSIPLADNACSSRHAQFIHDAQGWSIQDRGSLNGTFVNGQRIQPAQSVRLIQRDRILLGATEFSFELETAPAAAPVVPAAARQAPGGANYAGSFMQPVADEARIGRPSNADLQRSLIIDDTSDDAGGSHFEFRAVDPMPQSSTQTLVVGTSRRLAPPGHAPIGGRAEGLAEIKLRLIQDVSEKLVRILEPQQLLDEILTIVMEQAGADRGMLCLLNEHRTPTPIAVRGLADDAQVRISRTVLHMVLDRRSGVLIQQPSNSANLLRSLAEMEVCSTLCAPLWTGDKIMGLLSLDSTRPAKIFSEDDLDLLLAVAHQAAMGIERIRLSQAVESERSVKTYLSKYLDNRIVEQIAGSAPGVDPLAPAEKIVTVLFSDIVSFTKICEGLAPVEVAAFIREYLSSMTDVVFAHGGTIDKYIGDALMALFGAPLPSPSSAADAIRAALEMRSLVQSFRSPRPGSPPLRVRIGVNTGPVVVGNIGSTRRVEYTAIGDAVNVAARLQAFARPNEICIDETTHAQTSDAFVVEEIGTIDVRNRAQPVAVYKVIRAK